MLTTDFDRLVRDRLRHDSTFREALLAAAREEHKQRYGKRRNKKMEFEVSSGNVFADLGFPDAAELDIKLRLAVEIVRLINARRLSQVAAAALLKINQPKGVSTEEL